MPMSYRIDRERSLILTTAWGVLTNEDILAHKANLLRDPTFDPQMAQLSDLRKIERLDVTSAGVRAMVQHDMANTPHRVGHRMAFVVADDVVFGMARMYQLMGNQETGSVGVFRTMEEANAWISASNWVRGAMAGPSHFGRRAALKTLTGAAIAAVARDLQARLFAQNRAAGGAGRVRHSVCKWCYPEIALDDLCTAGKEFGLQSVELLELNDIPTVKKHGLTCAMVSGVPGGITRGLNRPANHDTILEWFSEAAPRAAALDCRTVICFSGNREGLDDEQGIRNCAAGIKRLLPIAERHNVVLAMELLNSRVNHKDYQCDRSAWGVALCEAVDSDHFKLLYDIYHMQIMEGDLIATINRHHRWFAHYHTGGVPGRHEIDETQEINYPAVVKAILATGFRGFIAQEFVPSRADKIASLRQGVAICDV